ncbi:MAG TPA: hypothetical protein V6C76_04325 [Drouetiella sp.]
MLKQYFRQNPRVAGLVFTIFGLIIGKFYMLDVLTAAQAHADDVRLSMKLVIFTLTFFQMGLILLITGPVGGSLLLSPGGKRTLPPLGWALVFIIIGLSFGGYFAFKNYIASFGYSF